MYLASYLMWILVLTTRFERQILADLISLHAHSAWSDTTTVMLTKAQVCCADQKKAKNKNLYITFFLGDVTICMYPSPPMSLFVTNLGYSRWRHFRMTPLCIQKYWAFVVKWILSDSLSINCSSGTERDTKKARPLQIALSMRSNLHYETSIWLLLLHSDNTRNSDHLNYLNLFS